MRPTRPPLRQAASAPTRRGHTRTTVEEHGTNNTLGIYDVPTIPFQIVFVGDTLDGTRRRWTPDEITAYLLRRAQWSASRSSGPGGQHRDNGY